MFYQTKTDYLDVINFSGFKFIMKKTKKIQLTIVEVVGYRDTLVNMIEIK